jgi:CMP-N-acetylneuraminic acid synthetase
MKIVGLIPARSGSKSIPQKNIIELGKHPLIAYSIAAARLSRYIEDIVVSTDSEKIANIARKYEASVPFLRPQEISQDSSLDIEFFRHYLSFLEEKAMDIPDLVVHLRPTTPLREIRVIDDAIKYMINNNKATSLRSMYKTHLTPYKMFRRNGEHAASFLNYEGDREFYNLPRQKFEDSYIPNGYVDIIRPSVLKKTGLLHGNNMKLWETDEIVDIDSQKNYLLAKQILQEERFKPILDFLEDIK